MVTGIFDWKRNADSLCCCARSITELCDIFSLNYFHPSFLLFYSRWPLFLTLWRSARRSRRTVTPSRSRRIRPCPWPFCGWSGWCGSSASSSSLATPRACRYSAGHCARPCANSACSSSSSWSVWCCSAVPSTLPRPTTRSRTLKAFQTRFGGRVSRPRSRHTHTRRRRTERGPWTHNLFLIVTHP